MRAADTEEHVLQGGRLGRLVRPVTVVSVIAAFAVVGAQLQQGRRVHGARVDHQAGDVDARNIRDGQRDRAVDGRQRRNAESEHDGVRVVDVEALVDVVDAGGQ